MVAYIGMLEERNADKGPCGRDVKWHPISKLK